jgi:hypothetical protein
MMSTSGKQNKLNKENLKMISQDKSQKQLGEISYNNQSLLNASINFSAERRSHLIETSKEDRLSRKKRKELSVREKGIEFAKNIP